MNDNGTIKYLSNISRLNPCLKLLVVKLLVDSEYLGTLLVHQVSANSGSILDLRLHK